MSYSEWKEVKLKEIGKVITGKTPSSKTPDHFGDIIPFVTPTDFKNYNKKIFNSERYLSQKGKESLVTKILPENSVIVTCIGSDMGKVAINKVECVTNQQINSIVIINEALSADYLYYNLNNASEFLKQLARGGTTMPIVNKGTFEEIVIKLPSFPEQKAIAATLSCLDDKIELNNRMNKTLEEMAQAIFKSWFIDFEPFQDGEFEDSELGLIPKGWRVGNLDECIDFYNGYAFKSKELLDYEAVDSYRVFKMGHIRKGGGLNSDGTKSWISKSDCKQLGKYILKKGDLLMCMTDMKGNVALLGHTALMNVDDAYIVNQRVGLLRANNVLGIGFPYLYILTNSKFFIEDLRGRANSGVQVNLSTSEIKGSKLVIAPEEVNLKFNNIVRPMFDRIFEIVQENQMLTVMRDTILPKLMSGEIRVPIEEVK